MQAQRKCFVLDVAGPFLNGGAQRLVVSREPEIDPVRDREASCAPHALYAMHDLAGPALARQHGADLRAHDDGIARLPGGGCAFALFSFDQQIAGRERDAGDLDRFAGLRGRHDLGRHFRFERLQRAAKLAQPPCPAGGRARAGWV